MEWKENPNLADKILRDAIASAGIAPVSRVLRALAEDGRVACLCALCPACRDEQPCPCIARRNRGRLKPISPQRLNAFLRAHEPEARP